MTTVSLSARQLREFYHLDPRLARVVFLYLELLGTEARGTEAQVTSIYRTPEEEAALGVETSGIHTVGPPYRAVDLSTPAWEDPEILRVVTQVNQHWLYDPRRPELQVAVYQPHGTGAHVHLQVHPFTVEKET